jgi:hypothetical protein
MRGGDSAAGHHRERALRGGADHRLVDARPGRVQGDEPVEEVVVGGQAPGDPLVEVVVRVDQARGHEVAGGVDAAYDVLQALGGPARAERLDAVAGDDQVAGRVLGVAGVHGRDRTVLDDDALSCCHGSSCFAVWNGHGRTLGFEYRGPHEVRTTGAAKGVVRGW